MGIGAHQRIRINEGIGSLLFGHHHLGQILQIDLVDDAGAGRHHPEVAEGLLPPAQELVALVVALELPGGIALQGILGAVVIHHDRVIDDQIHRLQWVNTLGFAAHGDDGVAHGRQIHDRGHAGKILQHHPPGGEIDLYFRGIPGLPLADRLDMLGRYVLAVLLAQQIFQQNLHAEWQVTQVKTLTQFV